MADQKTEAGQQEPVRTPNPPLTPDMPQPPAVKERQQRRVAREQRKGPFVKYVGAASHRRIHGHHWKTLAIECTKTKTDDGVETVDGHEWSAKNDFMIESSKFTDAQLDYLLIDDTSKATGAHEFLEVDYDKDGQLVQVTD
jgi:hypothetical protein